jgi:hypothetical protein
MDQALVQRIRQRAYEIWNAIGRPEGDSGRHWLAAEREVLTASMESVTRAVSEIRSSPRKTPRQRKPAPSSKDGSRLKPLSRLANGALGEHRRTTPGG